MGVFIHEPIKGEGVGRGALSEDFSEKKHFVRKKQTQGPLKKRSEGDCV